MNNDILLVVFGEDNYVTHFLTSSHIVLGVHRARRGLVEAVAAGSDTHVLTLCIHHEQGQTSDVPYVDKCTMHLHFFSI